MKKVNKLPNKMVALTDKNVSSDTITSTIASNKPASKKQYNNNDKWTSTRLTLKEKKNEILDIKELYNLIFHGTY